MRSRLTFLCGSLALLAPLVGHAQAGFTLTTPVVTGSAITTIQFLGTIVNNSTTTLFLNDLTFQFSGPGITEDNTRFFDLVPPSLAAGMTCSGLLFEVNLDDTVQPGAFQGKVLLAGGSAPDVFTTLSSQGFTVEVISRTATVTGQVALEGVSDLSAISPNAGLEPLHVSFRNPGTTVEAYGSDVLLTANAAGGSYGGFSIYGLPAGTFDVNIRGTKNLAVTNNSVLVSTTAGTVPNTLLPAGDANGDNQVDSADFNVFVGAYGSDAAIDGSGYDPTADFNYDGRVDAEDFNLLVGEFGSAGAP